MCSRSPAPSGESKRWINTDRGAGTKHDTGDDATRELYEAGFSTQGGHPQAGIALARTLHEARQRLTDMLVFCDPTAPATADIVAVHHAGTVERWTEFDFIGQGNQGLPATQGGTQHRV